MLAAVGMLLLVILGAAAWMWYGRELVLASGWLTILIALGLFGFKTMWGLNFVDESAPRELMIIQATAPEIRDLAAQLETLSINKAGDAHTLSVTVDAATGPVVAWYLRGFPEQRVVDGLAAPPDTEAAVTLAVKEPPMPLTLPSGGSFRGQGFPLQAHWSPWGLWGQDLLRWLLFNDGSQATIGQEVVLWVATQPW
jgi:hypothetical protein